MKSRYQIFLLILLVCAGGFIVVKNSLDERDISSLNEDVEALYQDRLLASNYIYRMNDLLHRKREFYADAVHAGKETIETPLLQKELKNVIGLYAATTLTSEEAKAFSRFKKYTDGIFLTGSTSYLSSSQAWAKITQIDKALLDLQVLSDVQVKEATVLRGRSGDVLSRALLALRLEWVLMVVIGLLVISFFRNRVLMPAGLGQVQRN